MTSQDEARAYLISLIPPGLEELYDLEEGSDIYKLFDAMGALLKAHGFDALDRLRVELFPNKVSDKLPDWEDFLGLARFFIARFGSLAQRQAAVVSKIREKGAKTDQMVQSVVGPLLGYAPTTELEVMRASRGDLRALHTYSPGSMWTIANGATATQKVRVLDGGKVSAGGARLILEFGGAGPYRFDITLRAPCAAGSKLWSLAGVDGASLMTLLARGVAGAGIHGNWVVEITNNSGANLDVMWSVFVEGIHRDQETGGAVWNWGVYADPAHVGEQGFSDFEAAAAAIARIKHSHTVGRLITGKRPYPGLSSGLNAAIPGRCIPSL